MASRDIATAHISLKIKMPRFPNVVTIEGPFSGSDIELSIGALNDETLEDYAEAWKQGLINHAKSKRGEGQC